MRTWISDTDLDVSAHEWCLRLVQSCAQTFWGSELDVAEALWLAVDLVFHDSDGGDLAISEKLFDIWRGDIVVEVAEMGSIRRLGREWDSLALEPWAVC